MNKEEIISKICELLSNKQSLLSEIYEITKQQEEWIKSEEWDRLINATDTKQRRIDSINYLESSISLLLKEADIVSDVRIKEIRTRINNLLDDIDRVDKSNLTKMEKAMEQTRNDIKGTQMKIQVNNAYFKTIEVQNDGYFLDQKK